MTHYICWTDDDFHLAKPFYAEAAFDAAERFRNETMARDAMIGSEDVIAYDPVFRMHYRFEEDDFDPAVEEYVKHFGDEVFVLPDVDEVWDDELKRDVTLEERFEKALDNADTYREVLEDRLDEIDRVQNALCDDVVELLEKVDENVEIPRRSLFQQIFGS